MESNISVLMSVYKNDIPENVRIAVESVVNQTLKPKQIVMVVDGQVPEALKNELLRLEKKIDIYENIWLEQNRGSGQASKEGVKYCKYELIARLDSDDISLPTRFEKQFAYLSQHQDVDVVGGLGQEFYVGTRNWVSLKAVPEKHEQLVDFMKARCPFCNSSVMMKKSALVKAGSYESWLGAEDWYLWIRMYLSGARFYNLQEILVKVQTNRSTFARRHGIRYYRSIKRLLEYMYQNKIITYLEYLKAKLIRFIGHVLVPISLESRLYRKYLRKKVT